MIRRALCLALVLCAPLSACGPSSTPGGSTANDEPRAASTQGAEEEATTPRETTEDDASASTDVPSEVSGTSDAGASDAGASDAGASDAPASVAPSSGATEGVRAQIAILERQCVELELVATQIGAVRPLLPPASSGLPPVCEDRAPVEALRITSRSGQAGSHAASAALESLDNWCEPFDRWAHPGEVETRTIRNYLQQIDRIASWMEDIDRCARTTGAERARCENAYDASSREAAAEARHALALLAEHVAELAPVRTGDARFPCRTPVLTRIEAVVWNGTVARAQLSRLGHTAMGVCERLGVADDDVQVSLRRTESALDRAESGARAQRRQLLDALDAMRPYVE